MFLVQRFRDMHILSSLWVNHALWAALLSFIIAQALKFLIVWFKGGKMDYERILGSGGMPSSHSSAITGLTVGVMIDHGVGSTMFALCFIMAVIICYDATGVRHATGEHAKLLNQLLKHRSEIQEKVVEKEFKELIGHTKIEVLAGVLLGLLVSSIYYGIRVI